MAKSEIIMDDAAVKRRMARVRDNADRPTKLFLRIQTHQQSVSAEMFRKLKSGGSHRGVFWPWFKDQYTRKTDGVTVPAEGGVANIGQYSYVQERRRENQKAAGLKVDRTSKRRKVQGKRRPSGKRVTKASNLMRDMGRMAAAVSSSRRLTNGGNTVELVTPVSYAARQNDMRPFAFFIEGDARLYLQWAGVNLLDDPSTPRT